MQPEALVKLAKSNANEFEAAWMKLVESSELSPQQWARYEAALRILAKQDQGKTAETLAWAAVEAVCGSHEPAEALEMAGPVLRAVGDCQELRSQVVELYKSAYAGCDGLDALLEESGLAGGRPVRRALRTLEVCLSLNEGDYLSERDEDGAAQVKSIDKDSWSISFSTGEADETLGAVYLADRFAVVGEGNFRVLTQFFPERLEKALAKDPASIVVDLCRENGNRIDSDELQSLLVPDVMGEVEWKKWWTRARAALKKLDNVQVEGRTPYRIIYNEQRVNFADQMITAFVRLRDPIEQLSLVTNFVRDCKARGEETDVASITKCYETLLSRAEPLEDKTLVRALLRFLVCRRIGEFAGIDGAADAARAMLGTEDAIELVLNTEDPSLQLLAAETLIEAQPDAWQAIMLAALPRMAMPVCEAIAQRLVDAGEPVASIAGLTTTILKSPVENFEALLWLWSGPKIAGVTEGVQSIKVLTRILRGLEECRRSDAIPRALATRLAGRARSILVARKCEQFAACVGTLEAGMAAALRRQLETTENLGRAAREDLFRILDAKFPKVKVKVSLKPWERDDVLYVTRAGMTQKQAEIDHHVNVKMRENAKAIGAAAEKGDLSENSEYKFALEERDLLRGRLAQMNAEVAMAEVLTVDDVLTSEISVGTRAKFKSEADGSSYEITFLGPWEADFDSGVLNYKSPLGLELMGTKIGDVVEFDHRNARGEFKLVEIHNTITDKPDDE